MRVYEQEPGQIMTRELDVRIWRLYFRGGPAYTKVYAEWLDKADVFKRASALGDLIDVEEV